MNLQFLATWMLMNANCVLCGKIGIPIFSMEGMCTCPSEAIRKDLRSTLHQEVRRQLQIFIQDQMQDESYCGDTPGWTRIVHLDMTNTSQLCPSGWFEETTNGLRLCGRNTTLACSSAIFSTDGLEYSQVCGQARGYQYGDVIGFSDSYRLQDDSIDLPYADGLTLTHRENGSRIHIWTFANGMLEDHGGSDICPCAPNFSGATIPAFVGSNYFCESGAYNPVELFILHDYDPLWDGSGCNLEGNTCCEFNSPPYFSTQLPSNTTDDIEGRICNGLPFQSGYTYITFLEIFIK